MSIILNKKTAFTIFKISKIKRHKCDYLQFP